MSVAAFFLLPFCTGFFFLWSVPIQGYGSGASTKACNTDMMPDHGTGGRQQQQQQTGNNPYVLTLSNDTAESGEEIFVTLTKVVNTSADFKGFMVWAKDEADDSIVGEFVIDRDKCVFFFKS